MLSINTNSESWDTVFPYFRKPVEYGKFSVIKDGTMCFDESSLRVLDLPVNVDLNLCKNFDSFIEKESSKSIHRILSWILSNRSKLIRETTETKK